MDETRNLILVKGENKTRQVKFCRYDPKQQRYLVTFFSGKTYPYAFASIKWLQDPEVRDPALYRISLDGITFSQVQSIYVFRDQEEWWHLRFARGRGNTYPRSRLDIEKSCLSHQPSRHRLAYLQEIAGISELKNSDGEVLLQKQYETLTFVSNRSAMSIYLHPESNPIRTFSPDSLIFPFGGNASQFKAVQNALSKQLSVIQGPPGTGKTQTILNILANLLVRGKTVQVVSGNNSAVQNVLEKLSSPKYDLGFLVAPLGNSENKRSFLDGQTGIYPDLGKWKQPPQKLRELKERVEQLSRAVATGFEKQERLALAKQELDSLEVESRYFLQFCQNTDLVRPLHTPRTGLKSETVLQLLQECEAQSEQERPLSLWHKLKSSVFYGVYEWKFTKTDTGHIMTYLESLFYTLRRQELTEEIRSLEKALSSMHTKEDMAQLTALSESYLKGVLYQRYGGETVRRRFDMEDLRENASAVLREYPVVLSTTFSSRSCLKNAVYDYLIMDEASQVDLATGALALSSAENAVIVGDLKQLPNVVPENVRKISETIFEKYRLPDGYHFAQNSFLRSVCTVVPEVPQTLLREHYRCHPRIIDFCNQKFYQNQLIIMTEDHGEPDTLCVYRTVPGQHRRNHVNRRQIDVTIQEVLPRLKELSPEDVGIIAPYRAQVQELAGATVGTGIEVDTVHKFQGREKDAIIITTVDDAVTDFSDDPYLLNVAISRAKKKLILVVSGNEQPKDSNIRDLIAYVEYHNYAVMDSELYSVFDLLYRQYTRQRLAYLAKHKRVSQYDSENLMYAAISDLLEEFPRQPLQVICHQKLRLLIRDTGILTVEEAAYATHPNTHVDFLIYNRLTKTPVLAIEVDGFHYHKEGTRQAERDHRKQRIFEKYRIPLLRLPTNGSGELQKIREFLQSAEG